MRTMYACAPRSVATLLALVALFTFSACPEGTDAPPLGSADGAGPSPDTDDAGGAQDDRGTADVDGGPMLPEVPPRQPGERAPRTADCDALDPVHCLLPWPSNVFTTRDESTETGVRLQVTPSALPLDPVDELPYADGFSRVTPVMTGFDGELDPATLQMTLVVAQGVEVGTVEPNRCVYLAEDKPSGKATAMICYPRRPLAAATEHLAIVPKTVTYADGTPVAVDRATRVGLGLTPPEDADDAALFAYHAPARAALEAAGVDVESVARMWDFTTRSAEDPRKELRYMRQAALDALAEGQVAVAIDDVTIPAADTSGAIAVTGRLTGLPGYATNGELGQRDPATGQPIVHHAIEAPFRAVIPKGIGDYRVVMFCHGMGGNVTDASFDELVTSHGAMKIGIEVDGWTDADMGATLTRFFEPLGGTSITAAETIQSLTGSSAILEAVREGLLSDLFAADTIGGVPNPAAGRRPLSDKVIWAGGSLGGTMGLLFSKLEPSIVGGVLNVPGAGYTHWLPGSDLFFLVDKGLVNRYDSRVVANVSAAVAQTVFDRFDGAVWADAPDENGGDYLVQISVGDPVLPNAGSDMVAASLNAVHVGVPLYAIPTLEVADEAVGRSGVTQFDVRFDGAGASEVHGFTARNTPAGNAAQQQFIAFAQSLWDGAPVIVPPQGCLTQGPDPSCDFSAP